MEAQKNIKTCINCLQDKSVDKFCKDSGYKDGRRSECNKCRNLKRQFNTNFKRSAPLPKPVSFFQTVPERDLPDPERLPAAYLKRCADYWNDLVDGTEPTTRIA